MSPATLYREGTDLDDLLAELDQQYPGRVRVVEIARPREGGVLGFFAKQRVGVHYRLMERATAPAGSLLGNAVSSSAGSSVSSSAGGSAGPVDKEMPRGERSAGRTAIDYDVPHGRIIADAGAPGDERLAASYGLTRRDGAAYDADATPERGPRSGLDIDGADPQAGLPFAQVLAELAVRQASRTITDEMTSPIEDTVTLSTARRTRGTGGAGERGAATGVSAGAAAGAPAGAEAAAPAAPATPATPAARRQYAAAQARAEAVAARIAADLDATPGSGFVPATVSTVPVSPETPPTAGIERDTGIPRPRAALDATPATGAPHRRTPRAVPQFQPLPAEAARTAARDLPAALIDLPAATRRAGTAEPGTTTIGTAEPGALMPAADTALPSAGPDRPGGLPWPLAGARTAAPSARTGAAAEAIDPRTSAVPGNPHTAAAQWASYPDAVALAGTPGRDAAAPMTLQRQLFDLGVPAGRIPVEEMHIFAAIDRLTRALPPAPTPPAGPGQVLVLAGRAAEAVIAADALLSTATGVFAEVWSYGCATGSGSGRAVTADRVIGSVAQAAEVARELRGTAAGPVLIVVGTDGSSWTNRAGQVIEAVDPDALWGIVDATMKPADARAALDRIGPVEAIAVCGAEHSSSPATVWDLDLPIALLDDRPSTPSAWAVLLMGLTADRERICSGVPC